MKSHELIAGLILGTLLILASCTKYHEERPEPRPPAPQPRPGPVVKPTPTPTPTPTPQDPSTATPRAASAGRYRSCDELQQAVYDALSYKQQHDARYLAAQQELAKRAARSAPRATSERVTAAAAAPQGAPPAATRSAPKGAKTAKQPAKQLEQFTNIQELGVDEPDHVKIGPDNVYFLRGLEIQVAHRTTLQHRGRVQLQQITRAKKLLITARHLFVLGELEQRICDSGLQPQLQPRPRPRPRKGSKWGLRRLWRLLVPEAHAVPGSMIHDRPPQRELRVARCHTRPDTVVQAFRLREDGPPEHVRSWRFKGRYVDARMTAGRIVLVFQQQLNLVPGVRSVLTSPEAPLTGPVPRRPIQLDTHHRSALLSCSAIYRSKMYDQDYRLTKVVALDASELSSVPRQAGFVGGGDQLYMSTENLYIAKVGQRWLPRQGDAAARARKMRDALVITQVGFAKERGEIAILAQTDSTIRGRPKDQWAFKELIHEGQTLLGVFTTTGKAWSQDPADVPNNYLWILRRSGAELPVVARIADIARGETIRSLRYIGDWAYAVTFKKTDPLFAIDLSDPLEPRIVGELKIPGFSTYMHPVGPGRLIGIGFDVFQDDAVTGAESVKFQGIKLSLFDVSDPKNMRELDTLTFGGRGSYSDVTGDHHAFFYDPQLKRLAFPLTLLQGKSKTEAWKNARHITFAGAVLVQVGGDKLRELARWRHNRWIPVACYQEMQQGRWWEALTESQDINRIYRVGEQYLTASRYGLKAYAVRTPQRTRRKLRFPGDFTDCGIGRAK